MQSDIIDLIESLSTDDHFNLTDDDMKAIRWFILSDGCTDVPDFYLSECIKHDFYYRTHVDFSGRLIKRCEADKRFRLGIQKRSQFGVFSPMSWWRWAFVRVFAKSAWDKRQFFRG